MFVIWFIVCMFLFIILSLLVKFFFVECIISFVFYVIEIVYVAGLGDKLVVVSEYSDYLL